MAEYTGIKEDNIVIEEARWYNRKTNPDTGTGITLNQGASNAMGIPEFYSINGRVGIKKDIFIGFKVMKEHLLA